MRVRKGWIALATVLSLAAIAACGGPTITDLPDSTETPGGTNSPGSSGTPGGSPTASGSGTPSAAPTITNVPSFATWQATIKQYECSNCHAGSSGSLYYGTQTDQDSLHDFWFSAICNYANAAGSQSYNPPTGKFVNTMCNMNAAHTAGNQVAQAAACNAVKAWLGQFPNTTPPDCLGSYDYRNSH